MKSYTDLEQSKKLAEILPIESADMHYIIMGDDEDPQTIVGLGEYIGILPTIPCWSLTALLSVIPKPDLVQNSEGTWLVHSWVNAYPWSVGGYSNSIDACYEMVLKLYKLNLL